MVVSGRKSHVFGEDLSCVRTQKAVVLSRRAILVPKESMLLQLTGFVHGRERKLPVFHTNLAEQE